MRTISYSAPAKIHLMGEHSVVHGKPALLAAINKRVTISISDDKTSNAIPENLQHVIENAIKAEFKISSIPTYSTSISSDIPVGLGLGSSAAMSAAFTACLLAFLEIKFNNALLFKIAYEGEKLFHGNPSGGDLAVSIEGGLLYFRKEFEFLKSFSKLDINISNTANNFYIINSGKPEESTLDMVKQVGLLKESNNELVENIFWDQEKITKELVAALKNGKENMIIESIKNGERNLEKLGVVGEKAKNIITEIENIGGAAKISGGGGIKDGSGMLLVYSNNKAKLKNLCKEKNLETEPIKIVDEGIQNNEN